MEQLNYNLLFRWFVGLNKDDAIWVRVLVLLTLELFVVVCATGQVGRIASASLQPAQPSQPERTEPAKISTRAVSCPPAGVVPLQPSSRGTGHHKVSLSWNAGVPSTARASKAVGYCLYRSHERYAAKRNPTCSQCERVNIVPIPGLSCVDDLVEDSTTYFYVVTAIDLGNGISSSSNEIPTGIPAANQNRSIPVTSPPPPLCRAASPAE